jgi:hypothetical protein
MYWSDTKQLPYQVVTQPVRMLSMVQLYNFLRILGPMPNLFSLLRGKGRHGTRIPPCIGQGEKKKVDFQDFRVKRKFSFFFNKSRYL